MADIQEKAQTVVNLAVGSAAASVPIWMDKILDFVHLLTSCLGMALVAAQLYFLIKKNK